MIFRYLLYLLFFVHLLPATTLEIDSAKNSYKNFELSYLSDNTKSLIIEEISREKFIQTTPSNFTLGYQKGRVWFKITLQNSSTNEEFILSLNEHFYERANLYYYDKKWIEDKNGLFTPVRDRGIQNSKLSFALNLPRNEIRTYYLEIEGKYAYFGNITLSKKDSFYFEKQLDSNIFFIYLLGILTIIVIFNLFLSIRLREKIYFYYVGYSFFNLLYLLNISGLLAYVNLQYYVYDLHLSAAFMLGFLILFSMEYLQANIYLKRVSKLFSYLAITFFVIGILTTYSYQPWNKIINSLAGISNIILIITSVVIYFKGNRSTVVYIMAILIYFSFVILFTSMIIGILEYSYITRYGFVVATTIEASLFSLLLADRYNQMKNEKIDSQNKLLDFQKNNSLYLEQEIKYRTDDLSQSNQQLSILLNERELLLKEVFHRVKNNFHMIIGILWIKGNKYQDRTPFDELINKIKSMAKINDYLYKSENLTQIKIDDYLNDIIKLSSSISSKKVNLTVMLEDINVSFDEAMNLGIILNELLTNSIKHNQDLDEILITIKLQREDSICFLSLHDNGKDFKEERNSEGIGMMLIKEFCTKLPESQHNFSFENGTLFSLSFKSDTVETTDQF